MIDSKEKYHYYLNQDKLALAKGTPQINKKENFITRIYFIDSDIWKFQKMLRKIEYNYNKKNSNPVFKLYKLYLTNKFKKLSVKLGFTIPPNVFGPGLRIVHRGTIVVNANCRIGANCTIHVGVNIGAALGTSNEVPKIGDNVYIAPGVKIYGDITIANGAILGTNAVVNKSFETENATIVGIPAVSKNKKS